MSTRHEKQSPKSNPVEDLDVLVKLVVREHALREHDVVQLPQHVLLEVPLHYARQRGPVLEPPGLGEPHPAGDTEARVVLTQGRRLWARQIDKTTKWTRAVYDNQLL